MNISFKENLKISGSIIIILWLVMAIDMIPAVHLNAWGIIPRTVSGLPGIFLSPFLHSGFPHLISNTVPLFVLLLITLNAYRNVALFAVAFISIAGGVLVWVFARGGNHIGASGLIYGLIAFLIANGIFRKDKKSLLIAVVVFILYGGLIWGVLPNMYDVHISWEGHLSGAIAGVYTAYYYKARRI
jgi:membrane associated rhomboid family serine protease